MTPYFCAFLSSDEQYSEPEVVELPAVNADLPDSFDSATLWPSCSMIGNVRDQSACGSCWASSIDGESRCVRSVLWVATGVKPDRESSEFLGLSLRSIG